MLCCLVTGSKTDKLMGVTEMLLTTSICGVVFALLSAQPLVIIGTTGPIIVFEEALYKVSPILSRRTLCTLCLKKNETDVTHYRFNPHQPISVIFGRDLAERVCY